MRVIEFRLERKKNVPSLFKPELKFMDLWFITHQYVETTSLNEETRKEVMVRIHDFSIQLQETFELYPVDRAKANPKTYDAIAAGLKEAGRRAKISLALNNKHSHAFAAYWPFLAKELRRDARILKDDDLKKAVMNFESYARTIKAK